MRLDRIAAELRPRSNWEAVDLGFSMVREWWKPLYLAWFVVVAPIALVLHLVLDQPVWLAALIIWWLRPLFDRVLLFILSRALFGDVPSLRETLAALPSQMRPGWFASITWARLDPARSYKLPVWQLEGLRGKPRSERMKILLREGYGTAVLHTTACVHFIAVLQVSLLGLVWMFIPESVEIDWGALFAEGESGVFNSEIFNVASTIVEFIVLMLIEPFYVAAGFSLYLNRRTQLEGWDIELAFKNLAQRTAAPRHAASVAAAIMFACVFVMGSAPNEALALNLSKAEAKTLIEEVLAAEEFEQYEETKEWVYVGPESKRDKNEDLPDFEGLEAFFSAVAKFGEVLMWLGAAALVILVLVFGRRWLEYFGGMRSVKVKPEKTPETAFGLDIRLESLPADIATSARNLWEQGDHSGSLSLMYRGALASLVNRDGITLRDSDTEGDCVSEVKQSSAQELSSYFARLTIAWQLIAYAHRSPADHEAQELFSVFNQHFGRS